jgi:hypothetical protein
MTELNPQVRVNAALGELNLIFQAVKSADGSPLWHVPFDVAVGTVVTVTLYLVEGWVVALHVLPPLLPEQARPDRLLQLNARLLGSRIALSADGKQMVIADLPLAQLAPQSLLGLLLAVVSGAEQAVATAESVSPLPG